MRPAVVFECVGVPGVLDQIMAASPRGTRIVVVGVCMEADTIYPMLGISKELNLQFVLGYTPDEFAATLDHIAEGAHPGRAADHRQGRRRRRGRRVRGPRLTRAPRQDPRRALAGLTTFAALRERNYRFYWVGLVFYVLGHRAEYVTFAWLVWEATHDALHLGYLGLAQGVPLVVFQLWGGVLADRVNRLRLLLATQVLTTVTLLAAFALSALALIRVEHLLALAALSNTFRAFDEPTRMSMVPQMVGRERLANAIALGSIPWQAGRMIGPSITGILIAAFGGTVGLALAAVASGMALAMYSRLHVDARAAAAPVGHMGAQLLEGLSFVRHNFVFAALICLALFNAVFGLSYVTLLPIFADVYFQAGSTGFGLLNAAHGTGALVGTLIVAYLGRAIPSPRSHHPGRRGGHGPRARDLLSVARARAGPADAGRSSASATRSI